MLGFFREKTISSEHQEETGRIHVCKNLNITMYCEDNVSGLYSVTGCITFIHMYILWHFTNNYSKKQFNISINFIFRTARFNPPIKRAIGWSTSISMNSVKQTSIV